VLGEAATAATGATTAAIAAIAGLADNLTSAGKKGIRKAYFNPNASLPLNNTSLFPLVIYLLLPLSLLFFLY
jgi:hypothetical protein